MWYPKAISRWGWVVAIICMVISLAMLSSTFNQPWWTVRVWNSQDNSICNEYVSIILDEGVCSEDGYAKADDSDCTKFSDSSAWNAADNYLNNPPNTQNADMEGATDIYVRAKQVISAALFFTVSAGVVALVAMVFSSAEANTIRFRGNFQLLAALFSGVGTLLALGAFASAGSSDLTDATYWEMLLCIDSSEANGTTANSDYTAPDVAYALTVVAFFFELVAFALIVAPGGCCFIPCGCCAWSAAQDGDEALLGQGQSSVQA